MLNQHIEIETLIFTKKKFLLKPLKSVRKHSLTKPYTTKLKPLAIVYVPCLCSIKTTTSVSHIKVLIIIHHSKIITNWQYEFCNLNRYI